MRITEKDLYFFLRYVENHKGFHWKFDKVAESNLFKNTENTSDSIKQLVTVFGKTNDPDALIKCEKDFKGIIIKNLTVAGYLKIWDIEKNNPDFATDFETYSKGA